MRNKIDILVAVGEEAKHIAERAREMRNDRYI